MGIEGKESRVSIAPKDQAGQYNSPILSFKRSTNWTPVNKLLNSEEGKQNIYKNVQEIMYPLKMLQVGYQDYVMAHQRSRLIPHLNQGS